MDVLDSSNHNDVSARLRIHHDYRTAITVNNIAITLLERCCFVESLATFQDALAVLKIQIQDSEPNGVTLVNSILRRAEAALAQASAPFQLGQQQQQDHRGFLLAVLSDNRTPNSALQSAAHEIGSEELGYVMRIIDHHQDASEGCCDENDPGLETGIILMNYGVAYRCVHHQNHHGQRGAPSDDDFLKRARTLFSVAYDNLSKRDDAYNTMDKESLLRRLLVHMLIVQNQIAVSSCNMMARHEYYNVLCLLRGKLPITTTTISNSNNSSNTAAETPAAEAADGVSFSPRS